MKVKNFKPIITLGLVAGALLILYLALPKVYINEKSIHLKVEAYEVYQPKELLKEYIQDQPQLYVSTNLGWRKQSLDEPLKIENDIILKLLTQVSKIKSEEITFEIKGVDTIAPKIILEDEDLKLEGGQSLQNHLNFKVMDYRYGNYDYELKTPRVDFIALETGSFEYIIEAQDFSGNKTQQAVQFEVIEKVIDNKKASERNVWITKARSFSPDFVPELVDVDTKYVLNEDQTLQLNPETLEHYEKMIEKYQEETKTSFYILHGYRSYEDQKSLYESEETHQGFIDQAGQAEHQSGYAIDVALKESEVLFEESDAYQWLKKNAYLHGFIIRYPKGKEDTTKHAFRSYQLRYVGENVARYLFDNNLTFDEYIIQNNI